MDSARRAGLALLARFDARVRREFYDGVAEGFLFLTISSLIIAIVVLLVQYLGRMTWSISFDRGTLGP